MIVYKHNYVLGEEESIFHSLWNSERKRLRSNIMNSVTLYLKVRKILNWIGVALKWIIFFLICELICGLSKLQELMLLNSKEAEKKASRQEGIFRKLFTTTSQTNLNSIYGIVFSISFIMVFWLYFVLSITLFNSTIKAYGEGCNWQTS